MRLNCRSAIQRYTYNDIDKCNEAVPSIFSRAGKPVHETLYILYCTNCQ